MFLDTGAFRTHSYRINKLAVVQGGHKIDLRKQYGIQSVSLHLDATFPNSKPVITHKFQATESGSVDVAVGQQEQCALPFYHPETGQWHWDCISLGSQGKTWCSLDTTFDKTKSFWGVCSEKHMHYSVRPTLGCMSVKLNGRTVLHNEPMAQTQWTQATFQGTAVCPTGEWTCSEGSDPMCIRTCIEKQDHTVPAPKHNDPLPAWPCPTGFRASAEWKCSGEGDEAKCTRECTRILSDVFHAAETRCPYGYYFPVNSKWGCTNSTGVCQRKCDQIHDCLCC